MSEGHKVPAAVAAALGAARPEMLKLAPKELSKEEIAGVYGILADLIRVNFEQSRRIKTLETSIDNMRKQAADAVRAARMAMAESEGLSNLIQVSIRKQQLADEADEGGE
jgi:hypothetical protein